MLWEFPEIKKKIDKLLFQYEEDEDDEEAEARRRAKKAAKRKPKKTIHDVCYLSLEFWGCNNALEFKSYD